MDPFVAQLANLCTTHRTRAKWVFVPTHAVGRTLGEEPQLRVVIDEALDTVELVAHAAFWQRAQRHEHSVETPFFVLEPANRLTNGVIDLLFQSDQGWQVVDYKTDVTLDDQSYEGQLEAYRAALRKVGCNDVDASVVSVRSKS